MQSQENSFKQFFENEDFIVLIDTVAKRYGKLPHEVLNESSLFEFNIDTAVMIVALYAEKKAMDEAKKAPEKNNGGPALSSFGIKRKTIAQETP